MLIKKHTLLYYYNIEFWWLYFRTVDFFFFVILHILYMAHKNIVLKTMDFIRLPEGSITQKRGDECLDQLCVRRKKNVWFFKTVAEEFLNLPGRDLFITFSGAYFSSTLRSRVCKHGWRWLQWHFKQHNPIHSLSSGILMPTYSASIWESTLALRLETFCQLNYTLALSFSPRFQLIYLTGQ